MIFEDSSKKRWKRAKIVFGLMIVSVLILLSGVILSLVVNPPLPGVSERQANQRRAYRESQAILTKEATSTKINRGHYRRSAVKLKKPIISTGQTTSSPQIQINGPIVSAFLVKDDPDSLRSVRRHGNDLNIIFPDWYSLADASCQIAGAEDATASQIIASSTNALVFPRVVNARDSHWLDAETSQILNDPQKSACLSQAIASRIASSSASGVNIDFENLKPEDKDAYLEFLMNLASSLHAQGHLLTVDVIYGDPAYDLEYIGQIADYVVLMAYDEHYSSGVPGPVASRDWFNNIVDDAAQAIPPKKLIVSLGAYGYDWTDGSSAPAKGLKFSEIMKLAKDSDSQPEMKDNYGYNFYFGYQDDSRKNHQVWFLNSLTAYNEWLTLKKYNLAGTALWRLGSEDENYWQIFDKANVSAADFKNAPNLDSIDFDTASELFKLEYDRSSGSLQLTNDTDGSIDYALYNSVPTGYALTGVGRTFPDKSLALTFDDGPDETYTPQILDVLNQYKVPAAFFMVGEQAQRNPDILREMAKGDYLFGNHTYLHPNIATISHNRLALELNQTERVIEAETGRKTIMFRAPYDTDSMPSTPEQLNSIAVINKMGYIMAGANIDSSDWEKPGVDQIVSNVLRQVVDPSNHVIVMHDAGGDRTQTVAALKILIPELRQKGYKFISLNEAAGLSREALNPPLSRSELFFVTMTKIWSFLTHWGWLVIVWLFLFTTIIAAFRILFLGQMVLRSAKHYKKRDYRKSLEGPVTVLVPVYNEEKIIAQTLSALGQSTKRNIEILVINDGSTDNTGAEVEKFILRDPRIRLISKANGGKSSALNLGMKEASNDIIVTIDGDTILLPEAVDELTKPFLDPQVDAVCGNVEVGNVRNILTGFQALEYITTQNFDRRAFDELNCISVVPGATGAWRKDKVLGIGGYGVDTLTEDADLTLRLLSAGGRVVYAPEARSKTEAPETISALAKQRFRWSYGTYQCLYKNRRLFFKGSLGWVALPNMLFFQIIFPILSPIGDLVFILSLFRGDFGAIAVGYIMFTFMDVCGSLLAFTLERKPKKLMWFILIQRFFYRQFMYVITYKSILAIIRGRRHGWNKLQRTGNVK